MGDWNLLGSILEEVHFHSTLVGKIWLTILFIFRMLVLGVAAEDVWDDEQSAFTCNTQQPGCNNICYDDAFPISLIRYWVLQIIFVSSPSLVYMGHALYRLRAFEKERQRKKVQLRAQLEEPELDQEEYQRIERELRRLEEQRKVHKAPLKGCLLRTYVLHILTRSVLEVGFMVGQYILYGFQMHPLYKCSQFPCPNLVDCFVSRPTEKTIFMLFMHSIAAISLFLNILEIFHLGIRKIMKALYGGSSRETERGPGHSNRNSVTQPCVAHSLLHESIPLFQPVQHIWPEQQVIGIDNTEHKPPWQPNQPNQTEGAPPPGKKNWSRRDQHHRVFQFSSVCPQDCCVQHFQQCKHQHHGQHPDSSFSRGDILSRPQQCNFANCPSCTLRPGEQPQSLCNLTRSSIDLTTHRKTSKDSMRECFDSAERGAHPGSCKASFLSRASESSDSQHSPVSDVQHWGDDSGSSSPPLPSGTGHRMSMASKDQQAPSRVSYSLLV
ncbi:gap junction alpha-10 protein [Dromiciops gliroides]|uniref:gap junction alpha-10 protein n=1 Tax=Dromiciops gliroides TaxID=33562 RepID=UPI001CC736D3|nr:gap junction alpha-10 protein [Dromiciops gliroides]